MKNFYYNHNLKKKMVANYLQNYSLTQKKYQRAPFQNVQRLRLLYSLRLMNKLDHVTSNLYL